MSENFKYPDWLIGRKYLLIRSCSEFTTDVVNSNYWFPWGALNKDYERSYFKYVSPVRERGTGYFKSWEIVGKFDSLGYLINTDISYCPLSKESAEKIRNYEGCYFRKEMLYGKCKVKECENAATSRVSIMAAFKFPLTDKPDPHEKTAHTFYFCEECAKKLESGGESISMGAKIDKTLNRNSYGKLTTIIE